MKKERIIAVISLLAAIMLLNFSCMINKRCEAYKKTGMIQKPSTEITG